MEVTECIPKERFALWLELFKSTSGRFITNPIDCFGSVMVRYTFVDHADYARLNATRHRLETNITETKRGFWKRLRSKF